MISYARSAACLLHRTSAFIEMGREYQFPGSFRLKFLLYKLMYAMNNTSWFLWTREIRR